MRRFIFAFLLSVITIVASSVPVQADTEVETLDGVGIDTRVSDGTGWTVSYVGGADYTVLNSVGDYTSYKQYIKDYADDGSYDYFKESFDTTSFISPYSTINSVTVTMKLLQRGSAWMTHYVYYRTASNTYLSPGTAVYDGDYKTISYTWTTCPATSATWTPADINNEEFGFQCMVRDLNAYGAKVMVDSLSVSVDYSPIVPICTLTGTITTATELNIVAGGKTVILTVANDTWVAAGGVFDAQRANIIAGLTSAGAEAGGWNATVKPAIPLANVTRDSNVKVTIVLPAVVAYTITANEIITVTVPATAVVAAGAIVASPTFTITNIDAPTVTTQAVSAITATTATGNGNVTSDGGSAITGRGTVYNTTINPDIGTGIIDIAAGTTGIFTTSIDTLTKGTLYHVSAYATNAIGTSYGVDESFITIGDPVVTTVAASLVSSSTAKLNSLVSFDGKTGGGEPCTVKIAYIISTSPHATYANCAAAPGVEVTVSIPSATYTVNQTPYIDVIGLTPTATYYFCTKIENTTATPVYGSVLSFPMESGVDDPTNLTAIPSATSISLTWNKGLGASNTMVRYLGSGYPTMATGILAYSGTGSSYIITGLIPGTTYYISAGGFTGAVPSAGYDTAVATTTTTTENITVIDPAYYVTPTQWFQAPDYTKMSKFPLYDLINWGADTFGVPRGTDWFTLGIIFSMCIGVGIYKLSTNIPAAAFSIAITIYFCSMMGLMEMWLMLPFILIGLGAWVTGNKT